MRAIGCLQPGPIEEPEALVEFDLPRSVPEGRDILVAVKTVSVNPVDAKARSGTAPLEGRSERILGWDAAGIVEAMGPDGAGSKAGDAVFYAGSLTRDGSNAEYQLVDERIVGHKTAIAGMGRGGCAAADRCDGVGDTLRASTRA